MAAAQGDQDRSAGNSACGRKPCEAVLEQPAEDHPAGSMLNLSSRGGDAVAGSRRKASRPLARAAGLPVT